MNWFPVFWYFSHFQWLQTEALQKNPKVDVSKDGMQFAYKPIYKLKDGKSLVRLLKQQDLKGLGGVLLDDIKDSLPHCDKVLKHRANEIQYITRPTDKKEILFYNDRSSNIEVCNRFDLLVSTIDWNVGHLFIDIVFSSFYVSKVDEEFVKLWRSVTVDAMDDAKIDEYLEKQGMWLVALTFRNL